MIFGQQKLKVVDLGDELTGSYHPMSSPLSSLPQRFLASFYYSLGFYGPQTRRRQRPLFALTSFKRGAYGRILVENIEKLKKWINRM